MVSYLDINKRHDRWKKLRKQSPSLHPSQSLHPTHGLNSLHTGRKNTGGQDKYKCDKVTHSLASHKKHILLHEEDKKKLKCFVCGHKFNFKSELDRHNVVHLTDRKHICPTRGCGKSFKRQSTLKCHQKVHDNLKINCPEGCDYWTTLQHYLKDHLTWCYSPLLVCEYSINGHTYTTRARSSQSRHEEYCPFKPFSTEAED